MKVLDLGDPDVAALLNAARRLKSRGATRPVIDDYLNQIYKPKPPKPPLPPKGLRLPLTLTPPTHPTAGLPDFPANDLFQKPGTQVILTAACELVYPHKIRWSKTKRVGGWTCYLLYRKQTAFVTHLDTVVKEGLYAGGSVIGTVAAVPNNWWAPHVHYGLHRGIYDPRT